MNRPPRAGLNQKNLGQIGLILRKETGIKVFQHVLAKLCCLKDQRHEFCMKALILS